MKHIEQILPEYAAEELERIVREEGDATASEALSRLLHDWTGCAIPPTATTPQSEVEELVPLCLSILRRHWTTPLTALGDGTTPMSLADLMRRLILGRVDGNEAWSIPPANANIPTAVSQLLARKISGVPQAPDGLSLAQLLCSGLADNITELQDSNKGWVMVNKKIFTLFPNVTKLLLGAGEVEFETTLTGNMFTGDILRELDMPHLTRVFNTLTSSYTVCYHGVFAFTELDRVNLPALNNINGCLFRSCRINQEEIALPELVTATRGLLDGVSGVKRILAPKLTTCDGYSYNPNVLGNCPDLEYAYIPNLSAYTVYGTGDGASSLQDMPKLSHLVIGKAPFTSNSTYVRFALDGCPNLVLLDIRGGLNQNIYLDHWSPTTALAERLPEFLSNFKTYIAQRLTDKGSGLTLTLSQAVRDAIQTDPEIVSIITSKGWTISPAPSV